MPRTVRCSISGVLRQSVGRVVVVAHVVLVLSAKGEVSVIIFFLKIKDNDDD